jgi:hypothetical protein
MSMETRMLASFTDELQKIAEGNAAEPVKPLVGGLGANVVGKPLPTSGLAKGNTSLTPKPARPTNYTMVHSNAPMAAFDGGSALKAVPPPPVET